jgi:hypothetical protein
MRRVLYQNPVFSKVFVFSGSTGYFGDFLAGAGLFGFPLEEVSRAPGRAISDTVTFPTPFLVTVTFRSIPAGAGASTIVSGETVSGD